MQKIQKQLVLNQFAVTTVSKENDVILERKTKKNKEC